MHASQAMTADTDTLTLIAGLHKQNQEILRELQEIKSKLATVEAAAPDPDDRWVVSLKGLQKALRESGMSVGSRRLIQFRKCDVFRVSTDKEDLECLNVGTGKRAHWRFHVGRCKDAIARFEKLPTHEKQRILGQ